MKKFKNLKSISLILTTIGLSTIANASYPMEDVKIMIIKPSSEINVQRTEIDKINQDIKKMEQKLKQKKLEKQRIIQENFIKNTKQQNNSGLKQATSKRISELEKESIRKEKQRVQDLIKKENNRFKRQERKRAKINNRQLQFHKVKNNYLTKINQIESCVLMSDTIEDLSYCNERVHNLSRKLNKIERRNKNISKNKYRNR